MSQRFSLNCPLPDDGAEYITLAHGSGGKASAWLMDHFIIPCLGNQWLADKADAATLDLSGKLVFSTDSFVVSPLFFPGGNIGELAVNGTVNDITMCGGRPLYLSLSFILEEGFPLSDFWEILLSIKNACEEAGVKVVTGDTKVVERGKGDGLYINTSGIGQLHPEAKLGASYIKEGDAILLSGSIANHGMAVMSKRKGLEFESAILSDTRPLNHVCQQLMDAFGKDIHFFRDPTRGGVATVLHEVATQANVGVEIHSDRLPVQEQVAGLCEILGIDPLYVANEGLLIGLVNNDVAKDVLSAIRKHPYGAEAEIIGNITAAHPGKVILQHGFGGKRWLLPLSGEQLPRIC